LTPDPENRRAHNPRNVGLIADALHKVGAGRSIVIDEAGVVLAGNATLEAAAEAGITKVQVVDADGETLIAVRRSNLSSDQKRDLAMYDNRGAELATWNLDQLSADEKAGVDLSAFFRPMEWTKLLASAGDVVNDGEEIPEMALQPFEEYNYLMVVCKNSSDWEGLCDILGVRREAVTLGKVRKVGLGRVIDGATLLETLCESSSRPVVAPTPSKPARSASSQTPRSASVKAKRTPTAG
jgi:hypothetical protein